MKRPVVLLLGLLVALGVLVLAGGRVSGTKTAGATGLQLVPIQNRLLSGFASFEFGHGPAATEKTTAPGRALLFSPTAYDGCAGNHGNNVKINQNCLNVADTDLQGRSQAENETAIAQDPNHPGQMVGASNDYLRGDGTCGSHWSHGPNNWDDSTMPNGFVRGAPFGGAREYFEGGGDPAVAWDSQGNAYYNCMMFDRGTPTTNNTDFSSGIYLYRSANNGASWNFTGRPVAQDFDTTGSTLIDKPYMAIDNRAGSPFQDRIYVTWTFFDSDGTAYIYEAYSNDYGESFSAPVLVSTDSPTLCTQTYGLPTPNGHCNENQDSDPFVGPDGALYVVFNNFNNTVTGSDNRNQVLLVKSTDGGASFSAPVKVGDFYDLPDCFTYQGSDPFRACVPEKGSQTDSVFRAGNYPSGGVDPTDASQIAVTFGSYINSDSNESNGCAPAGFSGFGLNLFTGVKTSGACVNKILISVSTDGGATFTGTSTDPRSLTVVNQDPAQATTDQWWQWSAFNGNGKLAVSYYDRQYGTDETSGSMDFSLSASKDLATFKTKRVTTSSMPLPTQFNDGNGNSQFFGDYTGLSVAGNLGHPIWMDTRNPDIALCPGTGTPGVPPQTCTFKENNGRQANDQDIYTAQIGLP